ncbi:MAG: hypothetical protein KDK12_01155 [Rhodobacteraceae bacterium]|nr:hypothetical protein [Paracoccaceae bacterium]
MTPTFPISRPAAGLMPRRLTMLVAALAVALAGLTAGARPARADAEDIIRFLAGAIVIGAIVNAIDDNQTPHYYGRWMLPDSCLETIRVNNRNIQSYNARCLRRAGYDNLPYNCRYEFRVGGGRTRAGYIAECLYEAGYRRQSGGYPAPYDPPFNAGRPPHRPPQVDNTRLPGRCEMHFRMNGDRVAGYWASCLYNAGFRNLPGFCLVTSTSGDRIYNAQCLRQAGYRD